MDKEVLLEILNTKYIEFTREEIKDIMNEELDKTPEEMDLGLVDLCLDALEGKFGYLKNEDPETVESQNKNLGKENPIELKRRNSIKRILIAAALVALIACVSIGVYADQRNHNVPEDIVSYGDGYYEVDLDSATTESDDTVSYNELTATLKENGISNAILPQVFFEDGCELVNLMVKSTENGDKTVKYNAHIKEFNVEATVSINKYTNSKDINYQDTMVSRQFRIEGTYTVNETCVLLFSNNNNYLIIYDNNSVVYEIIMTNCEKRYVETIINSIR